MFRPRGVLLLLIASTALASSSGEKSCSTPPSPPAAGRRAILVTGAAGQIGSELVGALRRIHSPETTVVIASGHRTAPSPALMDGGPFVPNVDVTNRTALDSLFNAYPIIDEVYHLAAILSAVGEKIPQKAWDVNMNGLINVLEVSREHGVSRVLVPSSIAAFGPDAPPLAPQSTALHPTTMYGVTKVAGELLCDYYVSHYGMDVRGLRLPGIISSETLPGGGTTDYAVDIFYRAVAEGRYTSFLDAHSALPMMYMPDCLKAMIDLMEVDFARLRHHSDFNVVGFSITPAELAEAIRKRIPDFEMSYAPDFRQAIADSWPDSMEDTAAREEWGWDPAWTVEAMTKDMLDKLQARHLAGEF